MIMNKYFKNNLRYLRNKNGIEQLDLALMLGFKSSSAVSEWEKGRISHSLKCPLIQGYKV